MTRTAVTDSAKNSRAMPCPEPRVVDLRNEWSICAMTARQLSILRDPARSTLRIVSDLGDSPRQTLMGMSLHSHQKKLGSPREIA